MHKFLKTTSWLAIVAGVIMVAVGVWGVCFTYKNVAQENIVTPGDASIPNKEVRGPFTLMSQAEIIREHALDSTGGLTYAEMPRQIELTDESGNVVLGEDGEPVMVPNEARNTWITVTALTTALHLGAITYAFAALVILLGLISIWTGWVFRKMAKAKPEHAPALQR